MKKENITCMPSQVLVDLLESTFYKEKKKVGGTKNCCCFFSFVNPEIKMKRLESPPSGRFRFVARVPVAPPTIRHIVSKSKPML